MKTSRTTASAPVLLELTSCVSLMRKQTVSTRWPGALVLPLPVASVMPASSLVASRRRGDTPRVWDQAWWFLLILIGRIGRPAPTHGSGMIRCDE